METCCWLASTAVRRVAGWEVLVVQAVAIVSSARDQAVKINLPVLVCRNLYSRPACSMISSPRRPRSASLRTREIPATPGRDGVSPLNIGTGFDFGSSTFIDASFQFTAYEGLSLRRLQLAAA
jgi:hypothetical protein